MMQDKVHPAATATTTANPTNPPPPQPTNGNAAPTPPPHAAAAAANGNPTKPPPPPSNPITRPTYRPQGRRPPPRRSFSCRRYCCLCFLYTLITLLCLILLAAIASSVFYFLYHPKHPAFSVSALRISTFNITTSSSSIYPHINSSIEFTLSAKNPNKKIISFFYDSITISLSSDDADLGNSSISSFDSVPGNVTVVDVSVGSDPTKGQDPDLVGRIRSDMGAKRGGGFAVDVKLDTKVKVKMGKLQTRKLGIQVACAGIRVSAPRNRSATTGATGGGTKEVKCKVDLRVKIWKFSP